MGFNMKPVSVSDQPYKSPDLSQSEITSQTRNNKIDEIERNGRQFFEREGGGGNPPGQDSTNVPNMAKHFEYERHAGYPWNSQSGYEPVPPSEALDGRKDIYEAPWGRHYTSHAIDRTLPKALGPYEVSKPEKPGRQPKFEWGGRSIPPDIVEYVIAYGSESSYARNPQHKTYKLGDVEVGVGSDGKTVVHVKYQT